MENTTPEVCLERYLKFLKHLESYKEEPKDLLEAKHLTKEFIDFLYQRKIRETRDLTEFAIKEYDLHLSSLVEDESWGKEAALRDRISDFLKWIYEEDLLEKDLSQII